MLEATSTPPDTEAHARLVELAHDRVGRVSPARLATHVLRVTEGADWPVQRAAMEALIRRFAFAQRDVLRVRGRAPLRSALGEYRTTSATKRAGARPYRTRILSLEPLRTSCDCADFVKSGLGLCKHGLVVLAVLEANGALARSPRRPSETVTSARLSWDPVTPPSGGGDRLLRMQYHPGPRARPPRGLEPDGRPSPRVLEDPAQRLALITALERQVLAGRFDADPCVTRVLREERERSARVGRAQAYSHAALKALASLKRPLYPYQREGVARFFETGRLLLADDMGLGKTTQAIAACHGLLHARAIRRGLLIVPAALKHQWKREWSATSDAPLTLVEGSPDERARHYAERRDGFLIIGYEQLLRDLDGVRRFEPELVVLDEAQRIKNWATKSAAYVKSLTPTYRLVLTGTPMENRLDELASIVEFVDEHALEPRWRLAPVHSDTRGDAHKSSGGARNLGVLRARLAGVMTRRVRQDVLTQLPPRTDTRVPVELTPVQRGHHDDLQRPIAALVQQAAHRPLTQPQFLRLMQLLTQQRMICNGIAQLNFAAEWPRLEGQVATPALFDTLFMPKLPALRGLIEQLAVQQQRKVVVFSQWRNMLRLAEWSVRDLLAQHGMRAVFFTGAESPKLRERAIVELHDHAAVSVMFLSDAGGVGLNLQRAASCCINLEMPWNPAVLEQRIGRIYRLGQTAPIDVYNLVSEEGIEANIAQLVARKKAVFSSLFDGTTDEVRFDGSASFMETVRKIVEPVEVPGVEAGEMSDLADLEAPDAIDDPSVGSHGAPQAAAAIEATAEAADGAVEPSDAGVEPSADADVEPGAAVLDPRQAARALAGVSMERLSDGSIRIHATPEAAAPLAELFESFARALRAPGPPARS